MNFLKQISVRFVPESNARALTLRERQKRERAKRFRGKVCKRSAAISTLFGVLFFSASTSFSQGISLRGIGAVNEGMAGVATATPVDSLGALQWNPATLSAFEKSNMTFGSAIILAQSNVESSLDLSQYGGAKMQGNTKSDAGAVPAPYMGAVVKNPESPITYGFGLYAIGGAQLNYAADLSNPILNPNVGLGRASSKVEIFQLAPTASYQATERLSIGFAPTITIARLIAEPLFFGPKNANGNWSDGAGTRYIWGGGFQTGLYYRSDSHFNYGVCYKSPQWTEPFPYNVTVNGRPYEATFELDYPAIYSLGVSFDGFEKTIVGVDARYFDYENSAGFKHQGYNADGSIRGLGWKSVFSVAAAAQHQINERFTIRGGYCFNTNPIESDVALLNVPAPMIMQHSLNVGATLTTQNEWMFSLGYAHAFKNSVQGKFSSLDPTSYVKNVASADSISLGVGKNF